MATELRTGTPADIGSILTLWAGADAPPTVTDDESSLAKLIARDPQALIVAESDGEIVGTLIAGFDGWRAGMYRLAVHPDHRRRGLALELVAEGERRLVAAGAQRITAMVLSDEDHATAFWTAAGYTYQPEISRFVRNF